MFAKQKYMYFHRYYASTISIVFLSHVKNRPGKIRVIWVHTMYMYIDTYMH